MESTSTPTPMKPNSTSITILSLTVLPRCHLSIFIAIENDEEDHRSNCGDFDEDNAKWR